jgi:hypothetical protein
MKSDAAIIEELRAATDGLAFISEIDYPLNPFVWPGDEAPTPEAVGAWEGRPDAPCERDDFARMFRAPTTDFAGQNDIARERVRRFRALAARLQTNLTNLCVIRVGGVEKSVYVLGRSPRGSWLGLKTRVVET